MATAMSPKLLGKVKHYTGDFCCLPGCSNSRGKCKYHGKNVSFYKFPQDEKRRDLWLKKIRRNVKILFHQGPINSDETPKVKVVETRSVLVNGPEFVLSILLEVISVLFILLVTASYVERCPTIAL